jgi:hypothetical protein
VVGGVDDDELFRIRGLCIERSYQRK